MTISGLMRQYAGYDRWANRRFLERLLEEREEVLDQTVASSFPTLRATLLHIRDAEHVWSCRIRKVSYSWPAEVSMDIRSLAYHCETLHDQVQEMTEEEMRAEVAYQDLRGNSHQQPVWQLLMHCFNHSTQHRGQLITMMRALGLTDIPSNDLVTYQRTLKATY